MDSSTSLRTGLRRRLTTGAVVVFCGALAAAGLSFAVGSAMSPYEGEHGFAGFLGIVFGDALRGRPAALALLLSPAAVLAVWWGVAWLWRRPDAVEADT